MVVRKNCWVVKIVCLYWTFRCEGLLKHFHKPEIRILERLNNKRYEELSPLAKLGVKETFTIKRRNLSNGTERLKKNNERINEALITRTIPALSPRWQMNRWKLTSLAGCKYRSVPYGEITMSKLKTDDIKLIDAMIKQQSNKLGERILSFLTAFDGSPIVTRYRPTSLKRLKFHFGRQRSHWLDVSRYQDFS